MTSAGIIFDFDGVLIESEHAGNLHLAQYLTAAGYPTSPAEAMTRFSGLAGDHFLAAIEEHIGAPLPADFHAARAVEDARVFAAGIDPVAGAIAFVQSLPPMLPRAIASSSTTRWIRRHLDHIGLRDAFEPHIYSGREHVARGKPAPDIYCHAAQQLGVGIDACTIIEDSVVGATGAVASGARVIGFVGGSHIHDGHEERLRAVGVTWIARTFSEIAALLGLGAVAGEPA